MRSYPQANPPMEPRPEPPLASVRWDRETERRHASLELAIKACTGWAGSPSSIVEVAEEYFRFLTDTRSKPPKEG